MSFERTRAIRSRYGEKRIIEYWVSSEPTELELEEFNNYFSEYQLEDVNPSQAAYDFSKRTFKSISIAKRDSSNDPTSRAFNYPSEEEIEFDYTMSGCNVTASDFSFDVTCKIADEYFDGILISAENETCPPKSKIRFLKTLLMLCRNKLFLQIKKTLQHNAHDFASELYSFEYLYSMCEGKNKETRAQFLS